MTASDAAATNEAAKTFGLTEGHIVLELGYDEEVDYDVREALEDAIDAELEDEDYDGVADAVVLWFRQGDVDLADSLVDAQSALAGGGPIWLFTPKTGRDGAVASSEISESATIAGLHAMNTISIGPDWSGTRLAAARQRNK